METKPGYQTSEFWMALLTQVAAIVNLFHPIVITNEILNTIASICAMIAVGVAYIKGRHDLKKTAINATTSTTTIVTPSTVTTSAPTTVVSTNEPK